MGIGIKFFNIEEKFFRPKIEGKTAIVDKGYEKFEEAKRLLDDGKTEEAFPLMLEAARQSPGDIEICETVWTLGQHLGRERDAARVFLRLIEHEIRSEGFDAALFHYKQLRAKLPDARLNNQMTLVLVEHLAEKEQGSKDAEELTRELVDSLDVNAPPGFLLQFSGAAMALSASLAEKAIGLALQHPDIPENKKEELRADLNKIAAKQKEEAAMAKGETPEDRLDALLSTSDYEPQRVGEEMYRLTRIVKATRAVPLALKKDAILLHVDKIGERTLSFDRIRSISLAKIAPQQENPYLLLDLFLSDPTTTPIDQEIRTIRLSSSDFSPQRFVPKAAGLKEAFQSLLNYLLKASGAKPYPDLDAVMLKRKLDTFPSINDYENSLPTPS